MPDGFLLGFGPQVPERVDEGAEGEVGGSFFGTWCSALAGHGEAGTDRGN